jgi:uncharacterized protein (TIGR01777 family)
VSASPKSRIIIAGGSGFLGYLLVIHFTRKDHEVIVLTRKPRRTWEVGWDGATLGPWVEKLEGAAALINLAGRTVNCRYNAANRREIMDSRVNSTRVLGAAIAQCAEPPRVWLNSSTATIYQHTYGSAHDESGAIAGTPEVHDEFSVEVARAWEHELAVTPTPRTRKVAMRTAMVLGYGANSVLPMLLKLSRLGLGGRMGDGRQYVSWIHETDFFRATEWLIAHEELAGAINIAAPNPLTNAEMMSLFRKAARAPFGLPATKWMLEIGAFVMRTETELILKSRRVIPKRLLESGFEFEFPTISEALQNLVGTGIEKRQKSR